MREIRSRPEKFQQMLAEIKWERLSEMNSVNNMVEFYTQEVNRVLDCIAPVKTRKLLDKKRCKFPEDVLKEIQKRDEMKRKIMWSHENNNEVDNKICSEYRKQRNYCNKLIQKAIVNDYSDGISQSTEIDDIWKKVK